MMKYILLVISFLPGMFPAVAQQPTDTVQLSEVTVSVEKHQQRALQVPASISAFNSATIQDQNINDLRDASALAPNFYMPEYGSKLTAPVYIRGVGSRINNPAVGLYVDMIPYFEKSMFAFDFNEVDQIEILRGPQGTLYGRNTLGGIINVTTRKPGKERDTRFSADFGNYGRQMYRFSHNQPLTSWLGILINAGYSDRNGYFTNLYDNRDVGSDLVKNGSLKIRATPLKNLILDYKLSGEKSNETGYPYGNLDSTASIRYINYNHKSVYSRDIVENSLSGTLLFGKLSVTSVSSFQYFKDHQDVDQDFQPKDLTNAIQDIKQKLYSQEIIFSSRNVSKFDLVGGVFAFFQHTNRDIYVRYGTDANWSSPKTINYDKNNVEKNSGMAVYGQATMHVLPVLDFTAGLRYDYEDNGLDYLYANVKNNVSSVVKDTSFRASYKQLMPKFSLQYHFVMDYMFYATVSKGYRGGGFNTSFVQPEDQSYGAESLWSYEIGSKANVLPGKLFVSADVFYIDWKNQQVSQRVLIGGNMYKNAGATSSKGIEAEFKAQPLHGFTMGGNLGYTMAKYKDFQPDKRYDTLNYKNKSLPFVPRYTYAGYVSYQRTIADKAIRSVQCMISLQGIGKQYWDDKNTEAQNSFSLLNASAGVGFHHFKLMIWAKNILNTHYYPYRFSMNNVWYAQAGAPFTTGITLSVELNSNHQ